MGKGKRTATSRRIAEASAEAPGTATHRTSLCPVVGCTYLALFRHETPDGVIYLCGRCNAIACANLDAEAHREELLEALAVPLKRMAIVREKRARR